MPEYSRAQEFARRLTERKTVKDSMGGSTQTLEIVPEQKRCWASGVFELADRVLDLSPALARAMKSEHLQTLEERASVESEESETEEG